MSRRLMLIVLVAPALAACGDSFGSAPPAQGGGGTDAQGGAGGSGAGGETVGVGGAGGEGPQAGELLWARHLKSPHDVFGGAVVGRADGSVVACGVFRESLSTGDTEVSGYDEEPSKPDIFFVSFDSLGEFRYLDAATGPDAAYCTGVVDRGNDLMFTGSFTTSIDFGGQQSLTANGNRGYQIRRSNDGAFVTPLAFTSSSEPTTHLPTVLARGGGPGELIAGTFRNELGFGGKVAEAAGTEADIFALRVDNGFAPWIFATHAEPIEPGNRLDLAAGFGLDGGAVVGGTITGGLAKTNGVALNAPHGSSDGYVLVIDDQGDPTLALYLGGANEDQLRGLAALPGGGFVATGFFYETIDLNGDAPLTVGSSARTGFLVRYADDLKLGWALPLTGTGDIWPWALTVDSAGNIIVAGELSGTADFGGGPITSSANIDGFVASFDADGQHRYSFGLPTTGDGRGGLVAASSDVAYVIVSFSGDMAVAGRTLSAEARDLAVVAFVP